MSDDHDAGMGPSGIILSFLMGGLVGAALAVLYAPRSGRETREMLGEKLREGAEKGRDFKDKAVARGRDLIDEAGDFVERKRESLERQRDRIATAVDAGRQAYKDEREKS
jgi:gas vesicle protein